MASTAVTGTGTDWAGNVRPGDIFRGPDFVPLEIASVESATALTLADPYQGATAATASYAIVPTTDYRRAQTEAVDALIADFEADRDGPLAGLFGNGSAAAPGVAFAADADTGLARTAPNEAAIVTGGVARLTIDEAEAALNLPLTGTAVQASRYDATAGRVMTVGAFGAGVESLTAVANADDPTLRAGDYLVDVGGVGGITTTGALPGGASLVGILTVKRASVSTCIQILRHRKGARETWERQYTDSAWTGWSLKYEQHNLIGTVSEAAGAPTGAVIQKGSGPTGRWRRFACGYQVAWYRGQAQAQWAFPVAFFGGATARQVAVTPISATAAMATIVNDSDNAATPRVWDAAGAPLAVPVDLIVQGRWY